MLTEPINLKKVASFPSTIDIIVIIFFVILATAIVAATVYGYLHVSSDEYRCGKVCSERIMLDYKRDAEELECFCGGPKIKKTIMIEKVKENEAR